MGISVSFETSSLNTSEVEHRFMCLIGHLYVGPREWTINAIYSISYYDGYLLLIDLY